MFVAILPLCFFAVEGLPFLSMTELKDCPNIPAQENVSIEQISGSWRLAYLFYDEEDELVEDNACIVADFTPISNTQMNIATHMDVIEEELVIDRSSLDLLATFHSPGEWLLHSNLSQGKACLRVKVVALTAHHMILTFCISNTTATESRSNPEDLGFNYILQKLRSEDKTSYNNKVEYKSIGDKELTELFGRRGYYRRKRSFFDKLGRKTATDFIWRNTAAQAGEKKDKHFWTIVLAKDNNVSAYNFVEVAAFLMKLGFDVKNGNIVSFGKCNL